MSSAELPLIAVTAGDVAGIGPEIVVTAVQNADIRSACRPVVICNSNVLQRAIRLCGVDLDLLDVPAKLADRTALQRLLQVKSSTANVVYCCSPETADVRRVVDGQVHAAAGDAAFQYLTTAIQWAQRGLVDAIATAPLNKASLHAGGHNFPGHTEILADQCGVADFAMMLHLPESRIAPLRTMIRTAADSQTSAQHGLSIAHVTLHTSIASVPQLLTIDGIVETTQLMDAFLHRIGCQRRSIAVCALNPHGGEAGLFGNEEQRIIQPAVDGVRRKNLNVSGPLPVDTLIRRAVAGEFDGVVAMYHDQGHIPVKLLGFDAAVNITLGLPIVRTSPTHGTAFDRAWNSDTPADPAGMIEAILTAAQLSSSAKAQNV
ncbi:MAG: 4-hydroxythreonine-4-phosphate dehydrogenase PdxA [Planctomycetaceae bacterium]